MDIKEKMEKIGEENGAVLSEIADRILRIKARNIDEYACPCYPDDPAHYCMSPLCKNEMLTKGKCHCGLFKRKEKDNDNS